MTNLAVAGQADGRPTRRIGAWSILGDRVSVEAMCRLGVDFIGIDCQHGFFAFDKAAVAIQVANLCGVPCYVRLPADQPDWIPRCLDAGADGIVLAMVASSEQARRAVELSRYQPGGRRSYGGGKRNGVGDDGRRAPELLRPDIFAMIETAEALDALDDVARVPGLSGLYVGPVDLGLAMARPYPLSSDDLPFRGALEAVVAASAANRIRPGMFATDGDDAREWLSIGFHDVVLSSDIGLLRRAVHENLDKARRPVTASDPLDHRAREANPYAGR